MKKLIFGIMLLFAIGFSLTIDLQKEGTSLSNTNLVELMSAAHAQNCENDKIMKHDWTGCHCDYEPLFSCNCDY